MSEENVTRKLTAILYADVAEYSRLTGEDEVATHRQLSAGLDVVSHGIEASGGRVVHYAGDAVLADFASVVAAVECAVNIQHQFSENNKDLADDKRLQFRIGINLGEVIVDRNEIYGDGVNVAARLESLAEAGGICISASVFEQVKGKLDIGFRDMGAQHVKNITDAVFAYQVMLEAGDDATPVVSATPASRPRPLIMIAAIAGIGLGFGWYVSRPAVPPDNGHQVTASKPDSEKAKVPITAKPTIAVLPFDNLSNDQEQEYFSDGITGDLITDLSKVPGLMVIGRNSTFSYKGKPTEIRQIGRELGVRYVLEGSVRKVGGQVRINAQLIDAITGGHLWADRYDGDLKNVFALQDRITSEIVAAMTVALDTSNVAGKPAPETAALTAKTGASGKTANAAAYDQYLQGWSHFHKRTPQDFVTAVTHFNRALELDPDYALAQAALASVYWESWKRFWQRHLGLSGNYPAWEKADKHLELAFKSPSPLTHRIKSEMLFINRRFDKAIAEAEISIALNPNDALGYVVLAEAKTFAGLASEAVPLMEKAFRLDPHTPPSSLYSMGLVQFGLGNYEKAKVFLERAIKKNHQDPLWYVLLIATYGHLNDKEKAKAANARLVELQKAAGLQQFSVYWPHGRWPFKDKKDKERLKQGMLAGGLPEY